MKVRDTAETFDLRESGKLKVSGAARFIHRPGYSEKGTKANNWTLAAQVVNAYPHVEAAMRHGANRIARTAKRSYLSMKDTGFMAAGVSVSRDQAPIGAYAGVDVDFVVDATDTDGKENAVAHLEFGHFQGKRPRGGGRDNRRWIPGRHVMRNASRFALAASPSRLRSLNRSRSRRRRSRG